MADPHFEPAPLSLEFRTVQKKKRKRAATAILVAGVLITASGVYGFARGGAEMLGVWGLGLGGFLTVLGIMMLMRAAKAR